MSKIYTYNHRVPRHFWRHILVVFVVASLISGAAVGWIWRHNKHIFQSVTGSPQAVPQVLTKAAVLQVNEPYFTMQLPADWQQTGSQNPTSLHTISWQATAKGAANRFLTIYIDTIPPNYAVNRELPLSANGSQLTYGSLSDNCANFTPGGTLNAGQAASLKPTQAVWQGVSFICNLPDVVDDQVGTGSAAGINSVSVTGPTTGTHRYFFLYIDRNIQPDYTILLNAIQSFRAK